MVNQFKCVDCGQEVPQIKEKKKLKLQFTNPGTMFLESDVMECPNCNTKYTSEEDADDLFKKIDKEYSQKREK